MRTKIALLGLLIGWTVPLSAAQRPFLMGNSFVADFFQYTFENPQDKDMFSVHVDDFFGIPWTNFENQTSPPASWAARMQSFQSGVSATGKTVYLALGPLTNRTTLAGDVDSAGVKHDNWAPVDSSGCYQFATDPNAQLYKQAYINYVKYMVDLFHPNFLSIAIEMNMQFERCPSQKAAFIQWYTDVYQAIKTAYPALPVFPTYQADVMYGIAESSAWCGGIKTDASFAACFQQHLDEAVAIPADRIAFSSYPLPWLNPPTPPDHYTPQVPLEDMFNRVQHATTRKIWISETGWQGVQIWSSYYHASPPSSCGVVGISTPTPAGDAMMSTYLSDLLAQAQKHQFEAVVWWENRDLLDGSIAAGCPCTGNSPTCLNTEAIYQFGGTPLETLYRYFGNMGLRYNDGSPREPIHSLWMSYLNQPYSSNLPGSNLNNIQIYPNPLRPSLAQTGMNFNHLPPFASLRIYTLAGEKVKDLTADSFGHAVWDGTNATGRNAASGVYFVYAQGAGESKTLKVAVQR